MLKGVRADADQPGAMQRTCYRAKCSQFQNLQLALTGPDSHSQTLVHNARTMRFISSIACPREVAWQPVRSMAVIMPSKLHPSLKSQPRMVAEVGTSAEGTSTACKRIQA